MTRSARGFPASRRWAVGLAFLLLYLAWGTTYYAIRVGVHEHRLPPALFSGLRVFLAGVLVLGFVRARGESIRLRGDELITAAIGALLLFVIGNGLIAVALDDLPSGVAAVIVATTPLWTALLEALVPGSDRLAIPGWLGLLLGLGGVFVLVSGRMRDQGLAFADVRGITLGLGSAFSWALGSLLLRYRPRPASHLASAAYQMVLGGGGLVAVGVVFGESSRLPEQIAAQAIGAFAWLLVVGSLVGFIAFNWLLGEVAAAKVGTYAYVNPCVAILVAWVMSDGILSIEVLGGMAIILTGVALVRQAGHRATVQVSEQAAVKSSEVISDIEAAGDLAHP